MRLLLQRPSPTLAGGNRSIPLRQKVDNELKSFPSGDSAQSAVIISCLSIWGHGAWWSAPVLAVVPLAMFGRCYFICHWALDTVAGALLGLGCVYVTDSLVGVTQVQVHHVLSVAGAGAAVAAVLHVTGVLPISISGIIQNLMPDHDKEKKAAKAKGGSE